MLLSSELQRYTAMEELHEQWRQSALEQVPPKFRNVKTVQYDPRFPNTNQTRNCHQNYVDFQRCSKVRGPEYEACKYFKKTYKTLCPNAWIEKWDEQVAEGRYPVKI